MSRNTELADAVKRSLERYFGRPYPYEKLDLIAVPGVKLVDIRRVYSHPVALDQCREFFRLHPKIEPVSFYDTAGSVKMRSLRPER